ncbi:hypothetical protein GIB67_041706 [Kingdonia uniflora]|uniref:BPL/LPL catalytic domain-containing protein n=1 Tax=Kingdonia uniflora TaxID=39325 RepID=A0A7J7MQQ2_9MAGN|nr:hypothetical protein GIB67_041706 [Kingdonia uniflora]
MEACHMGMTCMAWACHEAGTSEGIRQGSQGTEKSAMGTSQGMPTTRQGAGRRAAAVATVSPGIGSENEDMEDQPKMERLSLKKKGLGSEARAERLAKADVDLQLLSHTEQVEHLRKQKKRRNQGREDEVLAKLEKFKKSISTNPTAAIDESGEANKEDLSGWRATRLTFAPEASKMDDMARKNDPNDYVVHDPLLEKGKEKFNKMQAKLKRKNHKMILCVIPGISLALPCRLYACSVRSVSESDEVGFKIPGADWKTRWETRRCEVFDLHKELVPYREAFLWQESTVRRRQALVEKGEDFSDSLIILQHPPVYTLGTKSSEENLKFDINDAPYDIYRTKRGGEVTYHRPGQARYLFCICVAMFDYLYSCSFVFFYLFYYVLMH